MLHRALSFPRRAPGARGFTILDTMVASCVMLIGVVGLLSMQLTQVGAGARSRQLTEAAALLQQQMELLQLGRLDPATPPAPVTQVVDARGCSPSATPLPRRCATAVAGTMYTVRAATTFTGPTSARLDVSIEWRDPDGQSHMLSASNAR